MLVQVTNLTPSNISIETLNLSVPRFGVKSVSTSDVPVPVLIVQISFAIGVVIY